MVADAMFSLFWGTLHFLPGTKEPVALAMRVVAMFFLLRPVGVEG